MAARLELDETVGAGMALDPVVLSRIQFAFVISFHVVFVAFTVWLVACGIGLLILLPTPGMTGEEEREGDEGQA